MRTDDNFVTSEEQKSDQYLSVRVNVSNGIHVELADDKHLRLAMPARVSISNNLHEFFNAQIEASSVEKFCGTCQRSNRTWILQSCP